MLSKHYKTLSIKDYIYIFSCPLMWNIMNECFLFNLPCNIQTNEWYKRAKYKVSMSNWNKNDLSAAILIAGFNEKWLFNTYNLMKVKMEYDTNLIFGIALNHTVKEVYKAWYAASVIRRIFFFPLTILSTPFFIIVLITWCDNKAIEICYMLQKVKKMLLVSWK